MKRHLMALAATLLLCGCEDSSAPPTRIEHIKHIQVNNPEGTDFTVWVPYKSGSVVYYTRQVRCLLGPSTVQFVGDVPLNDDDWMVGSDPDSDYGKDAYDQCDVRLEGWCPARQARNS